jgi:hypothetical protein
MKGAIQRVMDHLWIQAVTVMMTSSRLKAVIGDRTGFESRLPADVRMKE